MLLREKTMKRKMTWLVLLMMCALCMPMSLKANMAYPYPVSIRQADGKEVQLRLYGDEFFHYTTDVHGYLLNQKADGLYYYSSFGEDGRIKISNHPYGSAQKMMHREQIPQALKDRVAMAREEKRMQAQAAGLRSAPARAANQGKKRQLVLLVEFADVSFKTANPTTAFSDLLNKENYYMYGAQGSARDYFYENSMQQFDPSFDVYGPYKVSKAMAEYGGNDDYGNDKDPYSLIIEALTAAVSDGVDLSLYDADNDKILDNVYVFYAGYSESEGADETAVWPHSSTLYHRDVRLNGILLGTYACSAELRLADNQMSGIGTFCHEYAHVLGLMDLYDTDYAESGGTAHTWGALSLMAQGSYSNHGKCPPYLCAEERAQLGWYDIPLLDAKGDYTILPVSQNQAYRINTENENEYFVIEYRKKQAWDSYIDAEGILLYHVDKSQNMVNGWPATYRWLTNTVNCYPLHRCMYIVDASNQQAAITRDVMYPSSRGNNSFSVQSKPSSLSWSGLPLPVSIENMQHDGEKATFSVVKDEDNVHVAGIVTLYDGSVLPNAVVQLSPIVETRSASGLRMLRAADAEDSYICRSNSMGIYGFYHIPAGTYLLTCQADKYMPVSYELHLQSGSYKQDMVMLTEDEQFYHEKFSWYNQDDILTRSVGTSGDSFILGARWTAEELKDVVGEFFGTLSLRIASGNPDVTAMVVIEDTVIIAEKTIENVPSGLVDFNFREDTVLIEPDQDYIIAFHIDDYPENAFPVVIDNGPAVSEKGDLIFSKDAWITLSDASNASIDANWVLSFVTCVNKPLVPVTELSLPFDSTQMRVGEEFYMPTKILPSDATYRTAEWSSGNTAVVSVNNTGLIKAVSPGEAYVKVTVDRGKMSDSCKIVVVPSLSSEMQVTYSQHSAMLSWLRGDDDVWELSYAGSDALVLDSLSLNEPMAYIDDLEPGKIYTFKIYAYKESVLTDSLERVITTIKTSSDYPAIYLPSNLKPGQTLLLDVHNVKSYEQLIWRFDGEEPKLPYVLELPAGEHLLEVDIHYGDNKGVESIRRKFKVKE